MRIEFTEQLALRVIHGFHGGACPDVSFVLPQTTRAAIAAAPGVVRESPGALGVWLARNEQGAPSRAIARRVLRIGLAAAPELANYTVPPVPPLPATNPEVSPAPKFVALYRPGIAGLALAPPEPARVVGARCRIRLERPERPLRAAITTGQSELAQREVTERQEAEVSFDLSGTPDGVYRFVESQDGAVLADRALVLDGALAASSVFGVVQLPLDDVARSFEVALVPKSQRLRYLVIARNHVPADLASLSLSEVPANGGGAALSFEAVAPTQAEQAVAGDAPLVVFRSSVDVPRSAHAKRALALARGATQLIKTLPHPGAAYATSDVIVDITKPKGI